MSAHTIKLSNRTWVKHMYVKLHPTAGILIQCVNIFKNITKICKNCNVTLLDLLVKENLLIQNV